MSDDVGKSNAKLFVKKRGKYQNYVLCLRQIGTNITRLYNNVP